MAENIIKMRIQNKYDTPENWAESNLTLKPGELGFDTKGRAKVGDGVHQWNELPYVNDTNKLAMIGDTANAENEFTITPSIDQRIYYFNVTKNTTLNFETPIVEPINNKNSILITGTPSNELKQNIDKLFFVEKRIYIENSGQNEIELTLGGNAEWTNDAYYDNHDNAYWGNPGMHLYLQATWIGGRIIVEVIDNDQLADNMLLP